VEKVILQKEVLDYLEELVYVLFENEYFSFKESAFEYVSKIICFAKDFIPENPHKTTPLELQKFGTYYVKLSS
jgi:hypothetical protein